MQGEGQDLVIEVGNVVLGRVIRLSSKQVNGDDGCTRLEPQAKTFLTTF
jgi:hypothetical protein